MLLPPLTPVVDDDFTLEVEDSLIALDGSLLVVDGNAKDVPMRPATQVSLKQVTAHLGEHMIVLRRDDNKPGLVPTQVIQATSCLFHSAKGNKTLYHRKPVPSGQVDQSPHGYQLFTIDPASSHGVFFQFGGPRVSK